MAVVTMKALLESGVHFGHRTHKWNPAMKPFIFTERNGIHIIDLQKTSKALEEVFELVQDTVADGGTVLFVGTKRQAQETIQLEATRCEMPWVTNRWLGGTLTNWRTIRQRINELERLERMRDSGEFSRITKKEALLLTRKIDRLEGLLGGVRDMARLPDLLFVVDVYREETAIHEANLLNIPVVAMVDTNCDPRNVDYVIPSNDDAIRAIKLVVGKIADAVIEGLAMRKEEPEEEMVRAAARLGLEEPELSDEELLGEATLAKLSAQALAFEEKDEGEAEEEIAEGEAEQEVAEGEAEEEVAEGEAEQEVAEEEAEEEVAEGEAEQEVAEEEAEEEVAEGEAEQEVAEEEVEEAVAKEEAAEVEDDIDDSKNADEEDAEDDESDDAEEDKE